MTCMPAEKREPDYMTIRCPVCGSILGEVATIRGAGSVKIRRKCKKCKKYRIVVFELVDFS